MYWKSYFGKKTYADYAPNNPNDLENYTIKSTPYIYY